MPILSFFATGGNNYRSFEANGLLFDQADYFGIDFEINQAPPCRSGHITRVMISVLETARNSWAKWSEEQPNHPN